MGASLAPGHGEDEGGDVVRRLGPGQAPHRFGHLRPPFVVLQQVEHQAQEAPLPQGGVREGDRAPVLDQEGGVGVLVPVGVGDEDGGEAQEGQLGQGRGPGPADDQVARRHGLGDAPVEVAEEAVALAEGRVEAPPLLAQELLVLGPAEVDHLGVVQEGLQGVADGQVEAVGPGAAPHHHHHRQVVRQVEGAPPLGPVGVQELGAHGVPGDDGLAGLEVAHGDGEGEGDAPGQGGEGAHRQPGLGVRQVEHHRDPPQAGGEHRRGAHVAPRGQDGVGAEGAHLPPGLPAGPQEAQHVAGEAEGGGADDGGGVQAAVHDPGVSQHLGVDPGRAVEVQQLKRGGPHGLRHGQGRVDVAGRAAARDDDAERSGAGHGRRERRPGGRR